MLTNTELDAAVAYNKKRDYTRGAWKHVQICVGSDPDGVPGPNTANCVAAWQEEEGLDSDGKVGPATMARIGAEPYTGESPYIITNMIAAYKHRTFGIDVSKYQGVPDWRLVKNAGVNFVFIKLTEGRTHQQPSGLLNWEAAKQEHLSVSGYHLANLVHNGQETDAVGGAENFLGMLSKTSGWNMHPALDLELKKIKEHADQYGSCKTIQWIEAWVETFFNELSIYPTIYISRHGVKELGNNHGCLPSYPTWWPDYRTSTWGDEPDRGMACWDSWTYRQITSNGKVPGVSGDVDVDYFRGTKAEWEDWTAGFMG